MQVVGAMSIELFSVKIARTLLNFVRIKCIEIMTSN